MPPAYVEELRWHPARPDIVCPTIVVHGLLDVDRQGSAPWRVREWAAEQSLQRVYFLAGVDHSLEPWLSAPSWTDAGSGTVPTFEHLVLELMRKE